MFKEVIKFNFPFKKMKITSLAEIDNFRLIEIAKSVGWETDQKFWLFLKSDCFSFSKAIICGDQVVSCCVASIHQCKDKRIAWLSLIATRPEFQGKGHGRKLVLEVIRELKKERICTICLDASITSLPFYTKLDFSPSHLITTYKKKTNERIKKTLLGKDNLKAILKKDFDVLDFDRANYFGNAQLHYPVMEYTHEKFGSGLIQEYSKSNIHIGPIYQKKPGMAADLLKLMIKDFKKYNVRIDLVQGHPQLEKILLDNSFYVESYSVRMFLGGSIFTQKYYNEYFMAASLIAG
jgi:GNAT superfamily N-acetyltransferase